MWWKMKKFSKSCNNLIFNYVELLAVELTLCF